MLGVGILEDAKKDASKETKENRGIEEKYASTTSIFESFIQIASHGDVASIYRNRPCFLNQRRATLVKPATDVFTDLPCSRTAVYYYTGLLVHETVHHWFNKKENVQQLVTIAPVKDAAGRMLDFIIKFFTDSDGKGGFEDVLVWLCELASELASKNAGRPAMAHSQEPDKVLTTFKSNEVIAKILSLTNLVVTQLLSNSPKICMQTLFEASRHGPHLSWMWHHIASLLQSGMISHLLESGASQFDSYVVEVGLRKGSQIAAPAVLNIIQTEYEHKFRAISDFFIFLMKNRNPELQEQVSSLIMESLDDTEKDKKLRFPFFFKIVTSSMETSRIMIALYNHLVTPFNAIRAVRQIRSIDRTIILPNASFLDFMKQIEAEVDPVTHGKILEMVMEINYNAEVFEGEDQSEMFENNANLRQDFFYFSKLLINRIVRIAHTARHFQCPSQHPSISAYASGKKLQFLIDSAFRHPDKSFLIVQHLHSIAIAYGKSKAAEIALRFLMTIKIDASKNLSLFMAFVNTTITFHPSMLTHMYREFSCLKTMIDLSLPDEVDRIALHMNLVHNLRTILDWEIPADEKEIKEFPRVDSSERDERWDKYAYTYFKLYPGEHMGEVLTTILADSSKMSIELLNEDFKENFLMLHRMITKIVESLCLSNSSRMSNRKFIVSLSQWYKVLSHLAILLKSALLMVSRENTEGISIFEELRTAIAIFLYNKHVDEQFRNFMPVFVHLFVSMCFADSRNLFAETLGISIETLLDETGLNKLMDMNQLEDGPSVLEILKNLQMRHSALDMLHTGQLKKRKRNDCDKLSPVPRHLRENSKQRVFAVLDAVQSMCFAGAPEVQLTSSKQLAQTLLHSICKDYMTCDMKFDEWDIEADFIHRHVEVDQKLTKSLLCDGILRILSETRSFAYCLPLMKSKLAVLINESERFPEKRSCSASLSAKLHNWIMLAHKGGILPSRFVHICDLENYATVHEIHLILLEIWKFMMFRNISVSSIDTYHDDLLRGDVDEGLPNEKDAMDRINLAVFRIVIQNHLPETFYLFPNVFPSEYDFLKLSKFE